MALITSSPNKGPDDNPHGGNNTVTIPAAVLSAFHARFPNATNTEWKEQRDGTFKAEFLRGLVKWQATFSAAGTLLKEEHN